MASQRRTATTPPRGVQVQDARRLLLGLPNVVEGRSYGMPSFLLNGRFLARFRDDNTVLVLQLATIAERDVLMQLEPQAFFCTEHYRSEEHTSELQSHSFISYAVFCLKKKKTNQ